MLGHEGSWRTRKQLSPPHTHKMGSAGCTQVSIIYSERGLMPKLRGCRPPGQAQMKIKTAVRTSWLWTMSGPKSLGPVLSAARTSVLPCR